MKIPLKYFVSSGFTALLLASCSEGHKLKRDVEYTHSGVDSIFSSTVYVFSDQVVSVYKVVGSGEDICIQKKDGKVVTSDGSSVANIYWFNKLHGVGAPKFSTLSKGADDDNPLQVIFGPGDQMPVLESAPYRIQGASVYVDWSKAHSQYFEFAHCASGSEVFNIKNEGLVLESSTSPGYNLTMGERAPTPAEKIERAMKEQNKMLMGK
jgi:hypothetical protein